MGVSNPTSLPVSKPVSNPTAVSDGGSIIAGLLGDVYRIEFDAAIFTPGTGGVAIGPDQANLNGLGQYDQVNAATDERPGPSTATGFDSWLFDRANLDFLSARNAATQLFPVGAHPWFISVIKATTVAANAAIFEINDGVTTAVGVCGLASPSLMLARWKTVNEGTLSPTAAFSDVTNITIVESELMPDRARLRINGAASDSAVATTGGIVTEIDSVTLGVLFGVGGWNWDGHILAIAGADSPTEDQKTAVREHLADKYGVTLP